MDIEIKERTKVRAVIYGSEYALAKPTIGQIERLQEEMGKSENKKNEVSLMKTFLAGLGLPQSVCDQLELDHFVQIVEHLSGTKKK